MTISVEYSEIELAIDFVGDGEGYGNMAFVDAMTGDLIWESDEFLDEDSPKRVSGRDYIEIPSRRELGVSSRSAVEFARRSLDAQGYETVDAMFRKRGAYRRFKDYLDEIGMLDRWHEYEAQQLRALVEDWAEEQSIELID